MSNPLESLTDLQLETARRLQDAKVAELDRQRELMVRALWVERRTLDALEQEQQDRLADKAWEHNLRRLEEEHRASRR